MTAPEPRGCASICSRTVTNGRKLCAVHRRSPWPGQEGHSRAGRPLIYRAGPHRWWVDASGYREQQRCFKTWEGALAYALRVPQDPDHRNARRLANRAQKDIG